MTSTPKPTSSAGLLPCPFCGGDAGLIAGLTNVLRRLRQCSVCDPNRGRNTAGKWLTINAPTALIQEIDALLSAQDGPGGRLFTAWMPFEQRGGPTTRRVICAAIRAADGSVLLGIRHYSADMHRQIEARADGHKFRHRHDEDQGFVDQYGVFMSRAEAFNVALDAGQKINTKACSMGLDNVWKLHSEGLY